MRYSITLEVEAKDRRELKSMYSGKLVSIVSISETYCPSIQEFALSRMYECGVRTDAADMANNRVQSHWTDRLEENPLHSRLELCSWCGAVFDAKKMRSMRESKSLDLSGYTFGWYWNLVVCERCAPAAIEYNEAMNIVARARSLLNRIRLALNGKPERATPWGAIEHEFRHSARSIRSIAADHGITEGAVRARIKKDGWTRSESPESLDELGVIPDDEICAFLRGLLHDVRSGGVIKEQVKAAMNIAESAVEAMRNDAILKALKRS